MKYTTKRKLIKCKAINEKVRLYKSLNNSTIIILSILGACNVLKFDFGQYFLYGLNSLLWPAVLLISMSIESYLIVKYQKRPIFNRCLNNILKVPAIIVIAYFIALELDMLIMHHDSILNHSNTLRIYVACSVFYIAIPAIFFHIINFMDNDNTKCIKKYIAAKRNAKLFLNACSVKCF